MKPLDWPPRPDPTELAADPESASNQMHQMCHPTAGKTSSGSPPDHTGNKRVVGLCSDSGSEDEPKMKLLSAILPSAGKLETCGSADHICSR